MDLLYWLILIVLVVISFRLILKLVGLGFKVVGAVIVIAVSDGGSDGIGPIGGPPDFPDAP